MVKVEFIKAFENVFSGYSGISCRDDDHTENKKELFQPQSANSAPQADVLSSPSLLKSFNTVQAKTAQSKGHSSPRWRPFQPLGPNQP